MNHTQPTANPQTRPNGDIATLPCLCAKFAAAQALLGAALLLCALCVWSVLLYLACDGPGSVVRLACCGEIWET